MIGGRVYDLSGVRSKPSKKNPEGAVRHGLKKCGECRKQFTAKVGTVFEHARMPLHKMLQAVHLMVSSKKGISSHQLSRVLEIQYKIGVVPGSPYPRSHALWRTYPSGGGGIVEVDETFIGNKKGAEIKRGWSPQDEGAVAGGPRDWRASVPSLFDGVNAATVMPIVQANIAKRSACS